MHQNHLWQLASTSCSIGKRDGAERLGRQPASKEDTGQMRQAWTTCFASLDAASGKKKERWGGRKSGGGWLHESAVEEGWVRLCPLSFLKCVQREQTFDLCIHMYIFQTHLLILLSTSFNYSHQKENMENAQRVREDSFSKSYLDF